MRISYNHKFVFLSNPRCRSSIIRSILGPYSDFKGEDHEFPDVMLYGRPFFVKNLFEEWAYEDEQKWIWNNYYKFAIIRNPFKRIAEDYFVCKPDKNFFDIFNENYDPQSAFSYGINEWLGHCIDNQKHLFNYEEFYCNENGVCLLDDIFKIEEIYNTFPDKFKEKTGVDILEDLKFRNIIDQLNTYSDWSGDPYSLFNTKSKELIEQIYKTDLQLFNYKFGE